MDITLSVQKKNDNTFFLVDSLGYICGVFSTEAYANRAMPAVLANLKFGKVVASTFKKNPYPELVRERKSGKKFYNKKSANKTRK